MFSFYWVRRRYDEEEMVCLCLNRSGFFISWRRGWGCWLFLMRGKGAKNDLLLSTTGANDDVTATERNFLDVFLGEG